VGQHESETSQEKGEEEQEGFLHAPHVMRLSEAHSLQARRPAAPSFLDLAKLEREAGQAQRLL
jgi:hypothetical protein